MLLGPATKATLQPNTFTPPLCPPLCLAGSADERCSLGVRMKPSLTNASSIWHVNRNLAMALHKLGVDVRWEADRWKNVSQPSYLGNTERLCRPHTEPYVTFGWGAHKETSSDPLERGQLLVMTSDHGWIWEPDVVKLMDAPDVRMVLALSPGCRDAIARIIPEKRIWLLPLGVDHEIYRPDGPVFNGWGAVEWVSQRPQRGAFVFLLGGYMQPRKGDVEALEAFCRAFSGRRDVAMLVKNVIGEQCTQLHARDVSGELRMLSQRDGCPPIGYLTACLSDYDVAALMRSVGCFVNVHHREGFGLMPLQSGACGTPALVTDFHGPTQYAREGTAYMLPVERTDLEPPNASGGGTPQKRIPWAYYNLDVLADLMRQVADGHRREEIVAGGLREAAKWTWERSARSVIKCIEANAGEVRRNPRKWHAPAVSLTLTIPVRNGSAKLAVMLKTLFDQRGYWPEILVMDDASNQQEQDALRQLSQRYAFTLLRSDRQLGIGGARAILYEQAKGEFVASLDGDLDFSKTNPHWPELLTRLWHERGQGIMAPLLLAPSRDWIWSAGAYASADVAGSFQHRFAGQPESTDDVDRPAQVCTAAGAFHFFAGRLLDRVRIDGAYFPAWYEDSDLCYQARALGIPVCYCPEVRVVHDAGSWTTSSECGATSDVPGCRARFMERWRDLWEDDIRRQNDTGALAYV